MSAHGCVGMHETGWVAGRSEDKRPVPGYIFHDSRLHRRLRHRVWRFQHERENSLSIVSAARHVIHVGKARGLRVVAAQGCCRRGYVPAPDTARCSPVPVRNIVAAITADGYVATTVESNKLELRVVSHVFQNGAQRHAPRKEMVVLRLEQKLRVHLAHGRGQIRG